MDLNKAMIIGRLTRDVELRQTATGQPVASFGLATNRVFKDQNGTRQERVEYHNIVAWGKLAEICNQYLAKGRRIYIEGRLQTRDWEGQDGVKRYRTEIVADNMIMLDGPNGSMSSGSSITTDPEEPPTSSPEENTTKPEQNEEEIEIENIPF